MNEVTSWLCLSSVHFTRYIFVSVSPVCVAANIQHDVGSDQGPEPELELTNKITLRDDASCILLEK